MNQSKNFFIPIYYHINQRDIVKTKENKNKISGDETNFCRCCNQLHICRKKHSDEILWSIQSRSSDKNAETDSNTSHEY